MDAARAVAPPERAASLRREALGVFALTFVLLAAMTHNGVFLAGNDASRFAQIEALVDRGQPTIDESRYRWTPDRVVIDGRLYSNKPPLLAAVGSSIYVVLREAFGLTFERDEALTVYWLTLLLIGGTTAWLAASFHTALAIYGAIPRSVRLATTLALATGTLLSSFAVTFNNHTVAAALLFAACRAAWSGRGWSAGLWLGLTTCVDIVPGLVFAPALVFIVADAAGRSGLLRTLASLGAGALLFVAVNGWIVGHPLPPRYVPGAVGPRDHSLPNVAGVQLPESWSYPLESLFGWHGFFTVSPVLLFGVIGLALGVALRRPFRRRWCLALGAATAAFIAVHAAFAGAFGGWSYGFRYLIPVVPILLFFAPLAIERTGARIFQAVWVVSAAFALLGAYHPWPPGYEREADRAAVWSVVTNPVGANLAAWLRAYAPDLALTRWAGSAFISPDREVRERYLSLFYQSRRWEEPPHR
jgi:hypothetical protein